MSAPDRLPADCGRAWPRPLPRSSRVLPSYMIKKEVDFVSTWKSPKKPACAGCRQNLRNRRTLVLGRRSGRAPIDPLEIESVRRPEIDPGARRATVTSR
jgi:hypothetical protein